MLYSISNTRRDTRTAGGNPWKSGNVTVFAVVTDLLPIPVRLYVRTRFCRNGACMVQSVFHTLLLLLLLQYYSNHTKNKLLNYCVSGMMYILYVARQQKHIRAEHSSSSDEGVHDDGGIKSGLYTH